MLLLVLRVDLILGGDRKNLNVRDQTGDAAMDLDEIVRKLNDRKQRATYGAVAGIVGGLASGLMTGRQKTQRNSWVVAATGSRRGWPTGYENDQIHPDCFRQISQRQNNVIEDPTILRRWLNSWVRGTGPYRPINAPLGQRSS